VKRETNGRVAGSTKDPVLEQAVAEAAKHGISKRTVQNARATVRGTKTPRPRPAARPTATRKATSWTYPPLDFMIWIEGEPDRALGPLAGLAPTESSDEGFREMWATCLVSLRLRVVEAFGAMRARLNRAMRCDAVGRKEVSG
jgi:hypothetical protein